MTAVTRPKLSQSRRTGRCSCGREVLLVGQRCRWIPYRYHQLLWPRWFPYAYPWDSCLQNGGFTTGRPWLPIPDEHVDAACSAQTVDETSVLNHYHAILRPRKAAPVLLNGDMKFLERRHGILAALSEWTKRRSVCACSIFNDKPLLQVHIKLPEEYAVNGNFTRQVSLMKAS